MQNIRVAAVICRAPFGAIEKNLAAMHGWIEAAHRRAVSLICFPELNISGYSPRSTTADLARKVPGQVTEQLTRWAATYNMTILAGLVEKDDADRIFATHLIAPPLSPIEVYRKLHIAPPEQTTFRPGNLLPVFKTPKATFGVQLCYDAHFPELTTQMALKGADIIFLPHASPRGTPEAKYRSWMRHLPARAFDNGLFIVACNQIGENLDGLVFPGVAVILNPLGHVVAHKITDVEAMLVADLKADELGKVRSSSMGYFLPQRRSDLADL